MFWDNEEDLLSGAISDIETESLATDTQRFLAILAFCLMAIFALVQSMPIMAPKEEVYAKDLTTQIESQNAELDRLRSENERLNSEAARLREHATKARMLTSELSDAQDEIERQRKVITQLQTERVERDTKLAKLGQRIRQREEKIRQLERQREALEKKLAEISEVLKAAPPKKEEPPPQKERRKGLYVAFESDDIFMDLLAASKIQLFITISRTGKVFQVIARRDGTVSFKRGAPSKDLDLWGIPSGSIPPAISNAFKAWTTQATREKMFIVGLTRGISRQIRDKNVTNGVFSIGANGKVTYSDE